LLEEQTTKLSKVGQPMWTPCNN